ncbi:MAG: HAMP domain-containing protein [Kiritimatiellae bacterium]|nr:HAMP domain-containing protein [Kiritimatiellia bacterium]
MFQRTSISAKINVLLLLVVFLPLLLMLGLIYIQVRQNTLSLVEENLLNKARDFALKVDTLLYASRSRLMGLLAGSRLKDPDLDADGRLEELRRMRAEGDLFRGLVLIDADGNVMASSTYGHDSEAWTKTWFSWKGKKSFLRAMEGEGVIAADRALNAPFWLTLTVAVPIPGRDGGVTGVLAGRVNIESVWEITNGERVRDTGFAFIVDEQGHVIAHKEESLVLKRFEPRELLRDLLRRRKGVLYYKDAKGVRWVCSFVRMEGYREFEGLGWKVGVVVRASEAFGLVGRMQAQVLAFSAGCLIFLFVFGGLLSRHIVKPIDELVRATEAIDGGNLNARAHVRGKDELGDLARSFNKMAGDLQSTIRTLDAEVSERRKAEQLLQKAHDELEVRVQERTGELAVANEQLKNELMERHRAERDLKSTTEELKRSNTELQQFAYVASHDLQEPLRMVSSYTKLLARRYKGKLDASADDFIGFAVDGVSRMQKLIDGLLQYSRVGTRGREFEPTNTADVLAQALANLQVTIEDNKAEITYEAMPVVMADEVQLGQLFQNLIGNAIKFHGPESPRVHVGARREGDEWVFSIRDNGIGIDARYVDRVFVIFQRLHTQQEYPGTGIGLAVCKRIVERHGGRIRVESAPGAGSTFVFTLPARSLRKEEA